LLLVACAPALQLSLVDKWNAKRAEAVEEEDLEEEEERPMSLDEMETAKKARLADWKASLSSIDTEHNTNFAPVAGDWRARVARARGGAAK